MKQRNDQYFRTLENHVLNLMKHGVTLPKWHALQVQLAHTEAKLKVKELENEALQRAYVRPDDIRAQLEGVQAELRAREAGVERLRLAIEKAEAEHKYACRNHGNSAQNAAWDKLQHLKDAMALVLQG